MILSCKEATELASRSLDYPLSWPQRLALRLHLIICHRCRHYRQQLRFLRRMASALNQHIEAGEATLPPLARAHIHEQLQRENQTQPHHPNR